MLGGKVCLTSRQFMPPFPVWIAGSAEQSNGSFPIAVKWHGYQAVTFK